MSALLALIPTKDWFYGILIASLLAFGVYERHHLLVEGQQHELAALQASSDRLEKKTATETAELQAKATMAEQSHDKEILALSNLPPVSVRVCKYPNSSAVLSQAGSAKSGADHPGASAGDVQSVPPGNSIGPDIGPMLSAIGRAADRVSAELREYQNRGD